MVKLVFRHRATGVENVPSAGGFVLAANHWSNFDPWPLAMPFFPRRFFRFMAKAELFWFPLGPIIRAAGAFQVRRGEQDEEAIATAVALAQDGQAIVMFPEGTRRRKGLRKKHEARWRTGAARIALEAQRSARACRHRGYGATRAARPAPRRVRRADPGRRPCRSADGRGGTDRDRPARRCRHRAGATGRLRPLLVIDGDSFTHRAYHALPKSMRRQDGGPGERAHRLHEHVPAFVARRAATNVLAAWDTLDVPTYRHEALEAYQSGRVFEDELLDTARPLARARRVGGVRLRQEPRATRRTTSSPPRPPRRRKRAARRWSPRPIATHSSS